MDTENTKLNPIKKHQQEKLSAPPGFGSLTSFTLKRVEEDPSMPTTSNELEGTSAIEKSLKHERKPWILHDDQFQNEVISESNHRDMNFSTKASLPKGVIRGCPECSDCQKVLARWNPGGACTYTLEEAPVFHPSEEEFKDTFKYIESIRLQVQPYGFCRIVPPPAWQLPCFLEEGDIWHSSKFATQLQQVNELQNPWLCGQSSAALDTRESKRTRLAYDVVNGYASNFVSGECHEAGSSQSLSGPQFTLIAFKRYADYFQQCYFSRDTNASPVVPPEPTEQIIEGEYWRIIEKPTEEIEVLHGTDLECRSFGSGLLASSSTESSSDVDENFTGWNLNCIASLPGSLLSFETSDSSGIIAPQLHIGMCFSSIPWTGQEHHLYKLYYLNLGAPRIWYGTSKCDPYKFEAIMKKPFADSSEEHLEQRHKLGRQVCPATLKSEDVQAYRCIQHPREFVLFLPGAYYSGFDCGFNCSVSAVFAPLNWLPYGLNSIELYRERRMKTVISYDKLLLRVADEVVKSQWECLVKGKKTKKIMMWKEASGKDGILAKSLRTRIRSESRCREYLLSANKSRKMDKSFDGVDQKRECVTCYYDLFLSAVSCPCSPDKFSCLKHAKHLCPCPWNVRVFLFRYLISELNILLEAVEGKLSAIRNWMKGGLGVALYWDKHNEDQHVPSVAPSEAEPSNGRATSVAEPSNGRATSVAEESNGRATLSKEVKVSGSKLLPEAKAPLLGDLSPGNHKEKESATAMGSASSDSSDDTRSLLSAELDIEAYISRLWSQKMRNPPPVCSEEVESIPNRTIESDKQNVTGSVAVPASNAVSMKDKASRSKLHSEAKARHENLKGKEIAKETASGLSNSSDDTSSSSSSDLDVEALIARLRSQRKRSLPNLSANRGE